MNPQDLQKQLNENAGNLGEFFEDLKKWGETVKNKKEVKKNYYDAGDKSFTAKNDSKSNKLGYTDYTAWEKFDADAECDKIDDNENEESELTDENDESVKDEACLQKEQGNKFVKEKKWDQAIECYNKAIHLYAYDAVFYANRALCFLKKQDYIKAERDSTMSIKLDNTYVKAYQRRSAAREFIGKLEEAQADLLKVLQLESNNKESKMALEALRNKISAGNIQRPISKFSASRKKKRSHELWTSNDSSIENTPSNEIDKEVCDNEIPGEDTYIFVKAITKPTRLQSKSTLKRISITEINERDLEKINRLEARSRNTNTRKTLKTDNLHVIEKKSKNANIVQVIKENKNRTNDIKVKGDSFPFEMPKNFVQFSLQWNSLNTVHDRFAYIKSIKPENLSRVFREALDSTTFSEILEVLTLYSIKYKEDVHNFLMAFSEIKRFATIVMFMTGKDKTCIQNLLTYWRKNDVHSQEDIDLLLERYELKK